MKELQLQALKDLIASKWENILEQPQALQFANSLMGKDRRVYALYLTQVYHYAFHTARNPVQRLGYSFWAETSYDHIRGFMDNLSTSMQLDKKQMTFFYNHSSIDDKHAKDVEKILLHICKTEEDWKAVSQSATITLDLTHQVLKAVIDEYEKLVRDKPSDFSILHSLGPALEKNRV